MILPQNNDTPCVLSIAGFDPTAGAGVMADIKTFEANNTYGCGVCTAITFQNDNAFVGLNWLNIENIKQQLDPLFSKYSFDVVKIGLIENIEVLHEIILFLKFHNSNFKIIWDPILKASTGFVFHNDVNKTLFEKICHELFLITPNWPEALKLCGTNDALEGAKELSKKCPVFLKGGHSNNASAKDFLFINGYKTEFETPWIEKGEKHGSGCVLSSAIAANLAQKYSLAEACSNAKEYINSFLGSSKSLLGYHFLSEVNAKTNI